MRVSRRLAAWTMPRSALVADILTMATERDGALSLAQVANQIADRAVAKAAHFHKQLAETQAQLDSLKVDFEAYVLEGERRG